MDITNITYLFYGFSAAWIVITLLVLLMVHRGRKIDSELARLRALVQNQAMK